jgi:hypothetical protein
MAIVSSPICAGDRGRPVVSAIEQALEVVLVI